MPDNKSPDDLRSRYRAIKEERQRRIDEHKRSIAVRPATATNLNILADGDSWFKYSPSMDVIDFVRQRRRRLHGIPQGALSVAGTLARRRGRCHLSME